MTQHLDMRPEILDRLFPQVYSITTQITSEIEVTLWFPQLDTLIDMHFEFLRQLRERQDQTAVIPTIADILLAQFQEEQAVRCSLPPKKWFPNAQLEHLPLSQVAFCVRSVLLAAPWRGVDLQGAVEVWPAVPRVRAAVQQQPAVEEDGHPRVHPHRDHQDHQVPAAHRAVDQDGQGPASGTTEAAKLSLPCQVHPRGCQRTGGRYVSFIAFNKNIFFGLKQIFGGCGRKPGWSLVVFKLQPRREHNNDDDHEDYDEDNDDDEDYRCTGCREGASPTPVRNLQPDGC